MLSVTDETPQTEGPLTFYGITLVASSCGRNC